MQFLEEVQQRHLGLHCAQAHGQLAMETPRTKMTTVQFHRHLNSEAPRPLETPEEFREEAQQCNMETPKSKRTPAQFREVVQQRHLRLHGAQTCEQLTMETP